MRSIAIYWHPEISVLLLRCHISLHNSGTSFPKFHGRKSVALVYV